MRRRSILAMLGGFLAALGVSLPRRRTVVDALEVEFGKRGITRFRALSSAGPGEWAEIAEVPPKVIRVTLTERNMRKILGTRLRRPEAFQVLSRGKWHPDSVLINGRRIVPLDERYVSDRPSFEGQKPIGG